MKLLDVVRQLFTVLPSQTNLFTEEVSISSLSQSGTTITAVTGSVHGLSTGNYVYVQGAKRKTPISTISRVDTVATAVTSSDHDLTEVWHENVEIEGADQSEYNGTHALLTSPNRQTFTFTVDSGATTPATGTMFLLEEWRVGYNGWVQVTVVDTTTFTYESEISETSASSGSPTLRKQPRISGAINADRAEKSYTKYAQNKYWIFAVLGDVTASKDRYNLGDAISAHSSGSTFRQQLIQDLEIYVFIPTKNSLSGRAEMDTVSDVARYLYKSLLGKKYSSGFVDEQYSVLNLKSHAAFKYTQAYYIHRFIFEGVEEITKNDVVEPPVTRAFRDAQFRFLNIDHGVQILDTLTNLDDEPL